VASGAFVLIRWLSNLLILVGMIGLMAATMMTVVMATAPRARHDDLWLAWGVGAVTALSSVALFLLITRV
jgi:hypothetical protein